MSVPDDQRLECKICLAPIDESEHIPRSLACGHSLCQPCMIKFWEQGKQKCIACPYCRQVTAVNDAKTLPKNFMVLTYLDEKNKLNEKQQEEMATEPGKCALNLTHKALFYCEKCADEFCERCFNQVHTDVYRANHIKQPINQKPYQLPKCNRHPQKDVELMCTDDGCKVKEKLMCTECHRIHHKNHTYQYLMDIVDGSRIALKNEFGVVKQMFNDLKTFEEVLSDQKNRENDEKEYKAKMDKLIDDHFDAQKALVKQAFGEACERKSQQVTDHLKQVEVSKKVRNELNNVMKTIKTRWSSKTNLLNVDDTIQISRVTRGKFKFDGKRVPRMSDVNIVLPKTDFKIVDTGVQGPGISST